MEICIFMSTRALIEFELFDKNKSKYVYFNRYLDSDGYPGSVLFNDILEIIREIHTLRNSECPDTAYEAFCKGILMVDTDYTVYPDNPVDYRYIVAYIPNDNGDIVDLYLITVFEDKDIVNEVETVIKKFENTLKREFGHNVKLNIYFCY